MKHTNAQKCNGERAVRHLSAKARAFYDGTDPLAVYEIDTDDGTLYDVEGVIALQGVTFAELQEHFEALQDAMDEDDD